jgi:hypothetical protein
VIDQDWWEAANALVLKAVLKGQEISEDVRKKAADRRKLVEVFIKTLDSKAKVSRVTPAYQWHRMDAPGCSEIRDESITIEEDRVKFHGFCTQASHKIRFDLDIELHAKIVPDSSSHTTSSVGKLTFTLTKAETAAWPQPTKGKKPSNVHVWWEMKERYQKTMNKLTGEEDDEVAEDKSGLKSLIDNPNVVIKDSIINGQRFDNSRDRDF